MKFVTAMIILHVCFFIVGVIGIACVIFKEEIIKYIDRKWKNQ